MDVLTLEIDHGWIVCHNQTQIKAKELKCNCRTNLYVLKKVFSSMNNSNLTQVYILLKTVSKTKSN